MWLGGDIWLSIHSCGFLLWLCLIVLIKHHGYRYTLFNQYRMIDLSSLLSCSIEFVWRSIYPIFDNYRTSSNQIMTIEPRACLFLPNQTINKQDHNQHRIDPNLKESSKSVQRHNSKVLNWRIYQLFYRRRCNREESNQQDDFHRELLHRPHQQRTSPWWPLSAHWGTEPEHWWQDHQHSSEEQEP